MVTLSVALFTIQSSFCLDGLGWNSRSLGTSRLSETEAISVSAKPGPNCTMYVSGWDIPSSAEVAVETCPIMPIKNIPSSRILVFPFRVVLPDIICRVITPYCAYPSNHHHSNFNGVFHSDRLIQKFIVLLA